jgi:hypothetical protein
VPDPPRPPVVPLREGLLHPLHYFGKPQPVLRLDIKRKPAALKTQAADLEYKPKSRLMEHTGENLPGFRDEEQRFPVVDLGADLVPHTLFEFS